MAGQDLPDNAFALHSSRTGRRRTVCRRCDSKRRSAAYQALTPDVKLTDAEILAAQVKSGVFQHHETPGLVRKNVLGKLAIRKNLRRIPAIPDAHHPYVDAKVWELVLGVLGELECHGIACVGDQADFYAVSDHSKDPRRASILKDELQEAHRAMAQLAAIPRPIDPESVRRSKIFVAGNHEDRFDRYIQNRAPQLFGLNSIRDLLGLEDWDYYPYKHYAKIGKMHLIHDLGSAGKYAHYTAQAGFEGNVVMGHVHRLGWHVAGSVRGDYHVGCALGWLGDFDAVDYMHKAKAQRDWAHGFGMLYLDMETQNCWVTPIPIVGGACVVEGVRYSV